MYCFNCGKIKSDGYFNEEHFVPKGIFTLNKSKKMVNKNLENDVIIHSCKKCNDKMSKYDEMFISMIAPTAPFSSNVVKRTLDSMNPFKAKNQRDYNSRNNKLREAVDNYINDVKYRTIIDGRVAKVVRLTNKQQKTIDKISQRMIKGFLYKFKGEIEYRKIFNKLRFGRSLIGDAFVNFFGFSIVQLFDLFDFDCNYKFQTGFLLSYTDEKFIIIMNISNKESFFIFKKNFFYLFRHVEFD